MNPDIEEEDIDPCPICFGTGVVETYVAVLAEPHLTELFEQPCPCQIPEPEYEPDDDITDGQIL